MKKLAFFLAFLLPFWVGLPLWLASPWLNVLDKQSPIGVTAALFAMLGVLIWSYVSVVRALLSKKKLEQEVGAVMIFDGLAGVWVIIGFFFYYEFTRENRDPALAAAKLPEFVEQYFKNDPVKEYIPSGDYRLLFVQDLKIKTPKWATYKDVGMVSPYWQPTVHVEISENFDLIYNESEPFRAILKYKLTKTYLHSESNDFLAASADKALKTDTEEQEVTLHLEFTSYTGWRVDTTSSKHEEWQQKD